MSYEIRFSDGSPAINVPTIWHVKAALMKFLGWIDPAFSESFPDASSVGGEVFCAYESDQLKESDLAHDRAPRIVKVCK